MKTGFCAGALIGFGATALAAAMSLTVPQDGGGPPGARPKLALEDLRFFYAHQGKQLVELSQPYDEVLSYCTQEHGGGRIAEDGALEPALEARLLGAIIESRGDSYMMLSFGDGPAGMTNLQGLSAAPTGDGGWHGVAGIVRPHPALERAPDLEPLGIAIRSDVHVHPAREAVEAGLWQEGKPAALADAEVSRDVVRWRRFTFAGVAGYAVQSSGSNGGLWLHIFLARSDGVIEAPFAEEPQVEAGALLWQYIPEKANDLSPHGSELFFLSDFSGNGYPEIVVRSTITRLYDLVLDAQGKPSLHLVRTFYKGP